MLALTLHVGNRPKQRKSWFNGRMADATDSTDTEGSSEASDAAESLLSRAPEAFQQALAARGFEELTEVQQAVLAPALAGRDLRISSQTGSGKTLALGFVVADALEEVSGRLHDDDDLDDDDDRDERPRGTAAPRALVIAPTRELATQLGQELSWLYGQLHVGIAVVTGGTSVGGDFRALRENPGILIGTPGRLVDLLEREALTFDGLREVVLDEADEMLDMGFRDELEALLDRTPQERRTHLVSATFPPKVTALADRYQREPVLVEGTVGTSHDDIHYAVIVAPMHERTNVLVNLMLQFPDERFLVFVRTRVAAAGVAGELAALGFAASPLSGEMAQRERNRCVSDFRARKLQCVVATDVAARGLDIRGVNRVVHYDLPNSEEAFTHRSGRTGRAGEKGESITFVAPRGRRRVQEMFRRLGVEPKWRTPPTPAQIKKAARRRLLRRFGAVDPSAGPDAAKSQAAQGYQTLAGELLERRPAQDVVADLLEAVGVHGPTTPRDIQVPEDDARPMRGGPPGRSAGPGRGPHRDRPPKSRGPRGGGDFVPFHITWGAKTGASPKRILAHICRRGGIEGHQVGSINIHEFRSVVDVSADAAGGFEERVRAKDPRNPKVHIERFVPAEQRGGRGEPRGRRPPRGRGKPRR